MQESATSLSSTCSAIPSTPSPQTTPTPSPLMAPPSPAQVPTSQAPTGHPTPPTPPSLAGCAKPNASRGQAGLTTTPTPAVCPSVGCPPSHRTPAMPTPPRAAPKSKAGLPVCSAYARGSAWGGWTGGARWGGCRGRVRWTFRDVLWGVRRELLGIDGGLWGVGCVGMKCRKLAVWGGVGM
jgi:hypothetical protein